MSSSDIVIIGGGIVGLATAYLAMQRLPDRSITVVEKESAVARHQTGRNSGVLHSGIYYKPGSAKAKLCMPGKLALEQFAHEHNIPFELCGKVIVAVEEQERPKLLDILSRGQSNGVECRLIDGTELRAIEPSVQGIAAIHVPTTGIIDFPAVCRKFVELIEACGHKVLTSSEIVAAKMEPSGGFNLLTKSDELRSKLVVNCAGLHSDRIAHMLGSRPTVQIVPFRGEYFTLIPSKEHLCRTLIYPVPDPNYPFLGVHFTSMIHGGVECGPNAVLAFAREGYHNTDLSIADLFETVRFPGFRTFAKKHWRTGLAELQRSFSQKRFAQALQRLVPEIQVSDIVPASAGIRAQALNRDGSLVDDFVIDEGRSCINVLNAPSPAATSCLAIGGVIADLIEKRFITTKI